MKAKKKNMKKENYDIIIIGAGIAGLSLGALLATRDDFNVLILEKNSHLGGRVRVQKKGGFLFDWGIHASLFGDKSKINEIFGSRLALSDLISMARILREFIRDSRNFIPISVDEGIAHYNMSQRSADILKAITIGLLVNSDFKQASFYELISFLRTCVRKRKAMGYPVGGWSQTLQKLEGVIKSNKKIKLLTDLAAEKVFYSPKVICTLPPQFIIRNNLIEKNSFKYIT